MTGRIPIASMAWKSLRNRSATAFLTIMAIAVSVSLLLGVEKVRNDARSSFANTISGTDLVVGARSGSIQLLLYSVFRIGNATSNVSWASYRDIASRPEVAWTIPLSLGDSHRGFRVLGTNEDYFRHYRFAKRRPLTFAEGRPFDDVFDAVLGAEVARSLDYRIGDEIDVDHGLGRAGFTNHEDKPFRVVGILSDSGTPVDRTVHVSLEGIEAIHVDWDSGTRIPGMSIDADAARKMRLQPKAITAFLVGLTSKRAIFQMQRQINDYRREPLLAVMPGVALQQLWTLMGTAEAALKLISAFVVASGLLGLITMLLAGLNERRREMAILRSVGARPSHIFGLLTAEALILTGAGAALGLGFLYAALLVARPVVEARYGLNLSIRPPTVGDLQLLGLVLMAGLLAGLVPAYQAYRRSLADGMTVRI